MNWLPSERSSARSTGWGLLDRSVALDVQSQRMACSISLALAPDCQRRAVLKLSCGRTEIDPCPCWPRLRTRRGEVLRGVYAKKKCNHAKTEDSKILERRRDSHRKQATAGWSGHFLLTSLHFSPVPFGIRLHRKVPQRDLFAWVGLLHLLGGVAALRDINSVSGCSGLCLLRFTFVGWRPRRGGAEFRSTDGTRAPRTVHGRRNG